MPVNFPLWARIGIGIVLAGTLAYIATPIAIVTARRFAFYDRPAGYKGHAAPTPYLGGAAVMLAYALALLIGAGDAARTLPLLGGVAVLFVVGTIDDRRTVPPLMRVAVEFGLGTLLAAAGIGWHLGAGYVVDAVVNGIWVVAVVNAFNLFDNMDGAASTMAVVAAAGACVLGLVTNDAWVAVGSAALCGACLGFLPHNLASPARIFLGDGGSMPLGFAVAALVASAARSAEPSVLALLAGFMLVGIPALDTCLVIVSRRRRGISILTGGQDHLTHRTRTQMRTARRVVLVLGSAQAIVSALVIVATRESSSALIYILLAFVVCAGTTIGALESVEAAEPAVAAAELPGARRSQRSSAAFSALFILGLGAGVSPLFEGYYNQRTWIPIGFALVVAAAAAMIARPPRLGRPAILVVAGIAAFGLFSLLSGLWADAVEQATIVGNLWLSYAAFLMLLLVFLRRRRDGLPLMLGAAVGIAIVGVTVVARMLGTNPLDPFVTGRLNQPLGYINGEGCIFVDGVLDGPRRRRASQGLGSRAWGCLRGRDGVPGTAFGVSRSRDRHARHRARDHRIHPRPAASCLRAGGDRGRRGGGRDVAAQGLHRGERGQADTFHGPFRGDRDDDRCCRSRPGVGPAGGGGGGRPAFPGARPGAEPRGHYRRRAASRPAGARRAGPGWEHRAQRPDPVARLHPHL